MGKSNRIRNNRASETLATPRAPKKKGMPSWALNVITIAVAAIILFSAAFGLLSANGVFTRMQTAVKSDGFRVNANMMKYFFQTQYSNFVSQNSSNLSYFGLDTGKSLKEQTVSFDEEGQTWYDYMMDMTEAQVKSMLVYCEEAEKRELELDDAAKESIDAELEMLDTYAKMYGYPTDSYIAMMYGKGVKKSDIRNCLEMTALAELCANEIGDEIREGISDADIDAEYESDKKGYNLVDMLSYSLKVTYKEAKDACAPDASEATVIAKYKEMIAETKTKAEALMDTSDKAAFESLMLDYILDKNYDDDLEAAEEDKKVAVESGKLPTAEGYKAIVKKALVAQIKALIIEDKDFVKDDIAKDNKIDTVEGLTSEYVTFIKTVAEDVYTDSKSAFDAALKKGTAYSPDEDDKKVSMNEWAFDDKRENGDKHMIATGDTAEIDDDADTSKLTSYTADVSFIVKKEYRDEEKTKNVVISVFDNEADAKATLEKLSAGMSVEDFESAAHDNNGNHSKYENYTEGSLGSSDFDNWLYKEDTTVGSYTKEVIKVTSNGTTTYMLAMYHEDGEEEWKVTVEAAIFSERSDALQKELEEEHAVEVKENVIAKIG